MNGIACYVRFLGSGVATIFLEGIRVAFIQVYRVQGPSGVHFDLTLTRSRKTWTVPPVGSALRPAVGSAPGAARGRPMAPRDRRGKIMVGLSGLESRFGCWGLPGAPGSHVGRRCRLVIPIR